MQRMRGGGKLKVTDYSEERPAVTWALLKRVLKYGRPYRRQIITMFFLILVNAGLSLITPLVMRDLIDNVLPSRDLNRLWWLAGALLLIPAAGSGLAIIQRRTNASIGEGVIYDLRSALYSHLQRMSLSFFTHTKIGEVMSRLNNDVIGAQNAISNVIVGIITNLIQAVALLAVMLNLEWRLTLISIAILPFFIIASRRLGDRLRDAAHRQMETNAQMNAMINETLNISGALLVKLFGRVPVETARFNNRAARVRDIGIERSVTGSAFIAIIGLLSAIGTALVYGLGGYLVIKGSFSIGTIVALGAYLGGLYGALQSLANAPVEFSTSVVSFERVFEVIDLPTEIAERPGAVVLPPAQGQLMFENVCFQYRVNPANLLTSVYRPGSMQNVTAVLSGNQPDGEANPPANEEAEEISHSQAREYALDSISFTAKTGQITALVGPSGAGKTTLTYLIPRLYDPTEGRILLDGRDLKDISLDSLTSQIGMVTQETHLFHDTIRTNLLYARLDAAQSEIEEAARSANIHDFIMDLPERYDTIVGERGYRLSGGEKQRLALARVILKNPRILILDEATSSLDSESEALIKEALNRVMAGRTSIVIAHRLSTILAADQILVMDRGRIVESGTHSSLMTLNGLYSHLYNTQFEHTKQ
ncbi:MAG: ABC transporter ATP-binding protein [Anaerolineaceae bacterium]